MPEKREIKRWRWPPAAGHSIALVAVASNHRGEEFAACEFIMDALKIRAPFWKKIETSDSVR